VALSGVHHDIWDRDFPAAPALYTAKKNGQPIAALAQITKQSYVYLFNRVTAEPLFPIEERPFPPTMCRERKKLRRHSRCQPRRLLRRQQLTAEMLTNRTPEAHAWAVNEFSSCGANGQFYPFAVGQQTVSFPGSMAAASGTARLSICERHAVRGLDGNGLAWWTR